MYINPYYEPYYISEGGNELEHYGVLGMKWGVRRYQNYDGTYTKKGLERYRKAEKDYETAKSRAKMAVDKTQKRNANMDAKRAKAQMKAAYKKLKTDKLADQGKMLYKEGKTISGNSVKNQWAQLAIVVGGNVASATIANYGNIKLARMSGAAITIGGTAINGILAARTYSQNRKLRAYYAH